jgi:hypothetical protein
MCQPSLLTSTVNNRWYFEGRKELAHAMVRLQLILFPKELAHFGSEHLVDFSTYSYLLHRFIASLVP